MRQWAWPGLFLVCVGLALWSGCQIDDRSSIAAGGAAPYLEQGTASDDAFVAVLIGARMAQVAAPVEIGISFAPPQLFSSLERLDSGDG